MSLTYSLNQPGQTLSRATAIVLIVMIHVAGFVAFNNGIGKFFKNDPPHDMTVINIPTDPPAQPPLPVPEIPKPVQNQELPPIVDPSPIVIDMEPDVSETPPVETPDPNAISIPTVSKLTVTSRIDPVYPASAQAAGKQGLVLLDTQVDPYGSVVDVTILQSSGFSELDAAAVQAVKRWHFAAISTGAHVRVPIRFQLNTQKR